MNNELLLIPEKIDSEREKIANAWQQNGGVVNKIGKFWQKPETNDKRVTIYGNDTFALVLAQILNLNLESPKDEIIAEMDYPFIKRKIEIIHAEKRDEIIFPKFIKPITPKLFAAKIFGTLEELNQTITDLEKEKLICSEIIQIEKEVRAFILNKKIMDLAFYEGNGNIKEAKAFIENLLLVSKLNYPKSFVLDLGWSKEKGWFVIELNSSWGAGLNNCKAEKVLKCIREATNEKKASV